MIKNVTYLFACLFAFDCVKSDDLKLNITASIEGFASVTSDDNDIDLFDTGKNTAKLNIKSNTGELEITLSSENNFSVKNDADDSAKFQYTIKKDGGEISDGKFDSDEGEVTLTFEPTDGIDAAKKNKAGDYRDTVTVTFAAIEDESTQQDAAVADE